MCFECVVLIRNKVRIPGCFYGLKDVLAAIKVPGLTDVLAKPTAGPVPVTDSLPALDDTTPHCSMPLTGLVLPHELMLVAQEIPDQRAGTAVPLVMHTDAAPYGAPHRRCWSQGWSQVDDDLSVPPIRRHAHDMPSHF